MTRQPEHRRYAIAGTLGVFLLPMFCALFIVAIYGLVGLVGHDGFLFDLPGLVVWPVFIALIVTLAVLFAAMVVGVVRCFLVLTDWGYEGRFKPIARKYIFVLAGLLALTEVLFAVFVGQSLYATGFGILTGSIV